MRAFEINNSQFQFKKERNNELLKFEFSLLFVKQIEQNNFEINNDFSVYNFLNNFSVFSVLI